MPHQALIQQDDHGLYVKTAGQIARPYPTSRNYAPDIQNGDSQYKLGDAVMVTHAHGRPCAHVGAELWAYHGRDPKSWDPKL